MRIQNKSSYPTEKFYPILDFVESWCKYSSLGTLYIDDTIEEFSHGMCHRIAPELDEIHLAAPSLIELWVRRNKEYPVVSVGVCGEIWINNWEEEVVIVLSHEMSHLDSNYGYPVHYPIDQNEQAEYSAEVFAITMLEKWKIKTARQKDFGKV